MKRRVEHSLLEWKNSSTRKPLLMRGARQVGKSHIVQKFGQEHFSNLVTINFELQQDYHQCFDTLEPQKILQSIKLLHHEKIEPGKTLLFLDEMQECPASIKSLRYFKEVMPELHVIGAGSLLEFAIREHDFSMPVGRITSSYMCPMSFDEFIDALGFTELRQYLENMSLEKKLEAQYENKLEELLRLYFSLGGMPEVVSTYIQTRDLQTCEIAQESLLATYKNDFAKYSTTAHIKYLQKIFSKSPAMVGQHFRYTEVDPAVHSNTLKSNLQDLIDAGILNRVYATQASGLPLNALINEKRFKVLFLDIGLIRATTGLSLELLQREDLLLLNRGAMAEQFVGQELIANTADFRQRDLNYWQRDKKGSNAEVDYVISVDEHIIPIEVKAGKTGGLKSLQYFLQNKDAPLGVRISMQPLSYERNVLSVPLYMISQLERLIRACIGTHV